MGGSESKNAFKVIKTVSLGRTAADQKPTAISSITISNDELFMVSSRHNLIDLWDAKFADLVTTLEGHQDAITCVRQTPDRRFIVSCSADGTIRVWVKPGGRWACAEVISVVHGGWAWHAEWLADIGFLSVGTDGHLVVWNIDPRGKLIEAIIDCSVHAKSITCATVLSDRYRVTIVTGSNDKTIVVSELTCSESEGYVLKFVNRLPGHEAEVNCLDSFVFPRLYGSVIVSGGRDSTIRIWTLSDIIELAGSKTAVVPHVMHPCGGEVCCVKFTQEGRYFLASTDKEITVFRTPIPGLKVESQKLACFLPRLCGSSIRSLSWGVDNTLIFAGTEDGALLQIQVPKMYHRHKRLSS